MPRWRGVDSEAAADSDTQKSPARCRALLLAVDLTLAGLLLFLLGGRFLCRSPPDDSFFRYSLFGYGPFGCRLLCRRLLGCGLFGGRLLCGLLCCLFCY